jgi:hypothetical protein
MSVSGQAGKSTDGADQQVGSAVLPGLDGLHQPFRRTRATKMTDPIAIGVIGAGIMGHRLMNAVLSHPDGYVQLAGAWDPSTAAMERLESELPGTPTLLRPECAD